MFTKILYINLDRRPERDDHINNQLKKINWKGPIERISAVDGKYLNLESVKHLIGTHALSEALDTTPKDFAPGSYMTRGAIGCALSHRDAYINILKGNHDKVLILEDDVVLDDNFNDKLEEYMNNMPDYDVLYLGYHESKSPVPINYAVAKPNGVVFGTYGMVIDKKAVPTLLKLFPIQGQIDSQLSYLYSSLDVYHLNSVIVHGEHSFVSNLGSDVQIIEGFNSMCGKTKSNNHFLTIIFLLFLVLGYYYLNKNVSKESLP